jgi:hypothetical protein
MDPNAFRVLYYGISLQAAATELRMLVRNLTQFLLLQFQRPGDEHPLPVAVILFDLTNDKLYIRGRNEYESIAEPEDALVVAETVKDLQADATATSGSAILESLESTLSNSILITDRMALLTLDIPTTLDHLSAAFIS